MFAISYEKYAFHDILLVSNAFSSWLSHLGVRSVSARPKTGQRTCRQSVLSLSHWINERPVTYESSRERLETMGQEHHSGP